ncbi:MAG: hypothetical protein NXI31_07140 [bacterium]|nr:hypothetical protein [bacterium]
MRLPHCLPLALFTATAPLAAQASPSADGRVAQIYDVGDLVHRLARDRAPRFEPPRFGIPSADKQLETTIGAGAIARLLRAFVKPGLRGNEEINPVGERWVVALGRPEQQAWIGRFLAAARGERTQPVLVSYECLTLPEVTFLQRIKPALTPPPKAADPRTPPEAAKEKPTEADPEPPYLTQILAPGAATRRFLTAMHDLDGVKKVTSQQVHVHPLQVAHMSTINQTAYVKDFDLEVAKNAFVADPVVDVIQDGIVMQAAVAPLENGLLGLSLDASVAELQRPIPEFETTLPGTTMKVKLQLPSLQARQVEAAVELQPGHLVLLALPPLNGERTVFVVRVQGGPTADPAPQPQPEGRAPGKRRGVR